MRRGIVLIMVLLGIFPALRAGEGIWSNRIGLPELWSGNVYSIYEPIWDLQDSKVYDNYRGFVYLDYTRKDHSDLYQSYEWKMTVSIQYFDQSNTSQTLDLEIGSEQGNWIYSDYEELTFLQANLGYEITVTNVQGEYKDGSSWVSVTTPQTDFHFPSDIDLRLELRSEVWYHLQPTSPDAELLSLVFDAQNYRARWSYLEGAEYYDFEWVWIDSLSREDSLLELSMAGAYGYEQPFRLKEPSRVRLWSTHYTIDQSFSRGTLYFRVRPVSQFVQGGVVDQIKLGEWTYFASNANYDPSTGAYENNDLVRHAIDSDESFEEEKNWLYGVAYAEYGKSVSSVTFYDGSNRGRQSLTYNTSDDITLIGETKFDREGRQTLSIIPAPVHGRQLGYRTGFNMTLDGGSTLEEFNEEHFDEDDYLSNPAPPLASSDPNDTSKVLGAAQYFSEDNKFWGNQFRAAIPDANGYVYSQTIYRNDGSGRIDRVGGIGQDFQVNGAHAVRTFYGTPLQAELKRLFGSNVADDPNGYRKEMVRDANGQYSVTYYDKRGHVIATALAAEAPLNLIELEDIEATEITSPLSNSILTDPYTLVSENTFLNQVENATITVSYDLTGQVNIIEAQEITVQGQNFSIGELCSSCSYTLTIEVLQQDGTQLAAVGEPQAPYTQQIQDTVPCPDTLGASHMVSLQYQLSDLGEYRIIKTLSVNREDVDLSPVLPSQEDFVDDYLEGVDISGCFDNCTDYCENLKQFEYDQLYGSGAWAALSEGVRNDSIASCMALDCNGDEVYEDFEWYEDSINPVVFNGYSNSCQSMAKQMKDQISPGGFLYDDLQSTFWACVQSNYFPNSGDTVVVNDVSYTFAEVQDPALYNEGLAGLFLPCHREYCHLLSCEDWAATMNYSNQLTTYLIGEDVDWPTSNPSVGVYATPYGVVISPSYLGGDPFVDQEWNGTSQDVLQYALANYINPTNEFDCPYNTDPILTSGTLYEYVENIVDCLVDGNALAGNDPETIKQLIFKASYDDLKLRLIQLYKEDWEYEIIEDITMVGCPYFYDDHAVFKGPMDYDQIEDFVNGQLSDLLNGMNCAETAWANVQNWIYHIPDTCLANLATNGDYDAGYVESELASDANTGNIEQLFYDYSIEGCPENTWGWFFDPQQSSSDPWQIAYDDIVDLLDNTNGCLNALSGFSVATPDTFSLSSTDQSIPDCGLAFIEMLGDGIEELNQNYTQPLPGCNTFVGNYTAYQGQLTIGSSSYPVLYNAPCNVSGDAYFGLCEDSDGFIHNHFTMLFNGSTCILRPAVMKTQSYWENCADAHIVSLGSFTKYASYSFDEYTYNSLTSTIDLFGTEVLEDAVIIEATFSNGATGYVYFETQGISCLDFGSFENQVIYDFSTLNDTLPDYTQDCIDATLGQAAIDAGMIYNEMEETLQNQVLASELECINVDETFTITYSLKEYQYTLYYYDLAGNLVQTVPPQGVHPLDQTGLDNNEDPDHFMETRYQYNGLNTLIAQYTPDGGHSDFILDKLYRVRYSQSADQQDNLKASYSQYDALGRIEEAGEIRIPNGQGLAYLQAAAEDALPAGSVKMDYTHTYYETGYPLDNTIAALFSGNEQRNLRNAIGAVEHRQAEYDFNGTMTNGSEIITVISYSYDPHKNVEEMVTTNYDLADLEQQHKHLSYDYDLISGNVNEVIYQQGEADEYRHRYHYDANNRLIRAFTSTDGIWWDMDAKYFYYLHGSLARTEIGHDKVQGTDYAYNLQGWLKGVNSSTLTATRDLGKDAATGMNRYVGIDAHGYMLGYYDNDYSSIGTTSAFASTEAVVDQNEYNGSYAFGSLYNGNITHMVTAMRDLDEEVIDVLANNYRYDQLQRIKAMDVYYDANLQTTNTFDGAGLYRGGAYQTRYSFDKNGNLLSLSRNGSGLYVDGSTGNDLEMDAFTYYYEESPGTGSVTDPVHVNRLTKVSDIAPENYTNDIKQGQVNGNYAYNASGQLVADEQEGIDLIKWTVTGKVKEMRFSDRPLIKFVYDAMDMRVAKIEYQNDNGTHIKYTYYTYDAQGNVMATYTREQVYKSTSGETHYYDDYFNLEEQTLYGASRLGVRKTDKRITQALISQNYDLSYIDWNLGTSYQLSFPESDESYRRVGMKYYELTEHRGNVLVVVTDRKTAYTEGAEITDQVGISVASNGTITRTAAGTGWNTSGGASVQTIGDNGYIEWTLDPSVMTVNHNVAVGLSYDNPNASYATIDYCLYSWGNGWTIFENSTLIPGSAYGSYGALGLGDVMRIQRKDGMILFFKNGLLIESRTDTNPTAPMIADFALYAQGRQIQGLTINPGYYAPDIVSYSDYYPYGMLLPDRHGSEDDNYRYGFNGMESDDEVKGNGNSYTTEFRQYDPRIGRWLTLDPLMAEFAGFSPYCFSFNSPLRFNDVKGDRPLPVNLTFNGMGWRIDSGFGRRNVRSDKGASKFHRGVDINTTGGGSTDFGAPVLATHDGIVKMVHDETTGGGGRYIQIVSPDGSFATQYLHLSEASVVEGQVIKEGDVIGKVGGSARGSESGVPVHLHYEMMLLDAKGNKTKFDPLFDSDEDANTNNDINGLIDPQKWVTGELLLGTNTPNPDYQGDVQQIPEVTVVADRKSTSNTSSTNNSSSRPKKQNAFVKAWNDGMSRIKSFMRHGR